MASEKSGREAIFLETGGMCISAGRGHSGAQKKARSVQGSGPSFFLRAVSLAESEWMGLVIFSRVARNSPLAFLS